MTSPPGGRRCRAAEMSHSFVESAIVSGLPGVPLDDRPGPRFCLRRNLLTMHLNPLPVLALVSAFALVGCGKKDDPINQAAQPPAASAASARCLGCDGGRPPRHRRGQGDRRGGVHLRPAAGHELCGDERVCRGQELGPVQGAVQQHRQRGARVHLQGHRRRHAQQRHAVLHALAGPARRADGDLGAGGGQEALLLGAADRRQHLQLRLHRQPRHRQRGGQLPGGRAGLERRDAARHQEGVPVHDAVRADHFPNAAFQCGRHAQRGEGAGGLQGAAALKLPEAAGAAGRAGHRLRPRHHRRHQGQLLRLPRRGPAIRAGHRRGPRHPRPARDHRHRARQDLRVQGPLAGAQGRRAAGHEGRRRQDHPVSGHRHEGHQRLEGRRDVR